MSRHGPTHFYRSFAYLLITACKTWSRGDEHTANFTTVWPDVTCARCLEHKPRSAKEKAELERLTLANKGPA